MPGPGSGCRARWRRGLLASGGFLDPGGEPQQVRCAGVGKRVMSTPISAIIVCAAVTPMAGISSRRPTAAAKGAICSSMRASTAAMSPFIASTRDSIRVSRNAWWALNLPMNASRRIGSQLACLPWRAATARDDLGRPLRPVVASLAQQQWRTTRRGPSGREPRPRMLNSPGWVRLEVARRRAARASAPRGCPRVERWCGHGRIGGRSPTAGGASARRHLRARRDPASQPRDQGVRGRDRARRRGCVSGLKRLGFPAVVMRAAARG